MIGYTRLVFCNMLLPTAPSPTLNKAPPAKHRITFIMVESNGVMDGTIINSSKPTARDPIIESHSFCFPTVLMSTKMETNTAIKNIFDSRHITIPLTPAVPASKDKPAILPPTIAPIK